MRFLSMRRWVPLAAVVAVVLVAVLMTALRGLSTLAQTVEAWTVRPRVLTGNDAFETVTVTDSASNRQTGEFDGEPGDDLALVELGTVQILRPATLAERQRLELGGDLRLHSTASSRLTRLRGALVIVDTGGGLEETRVRELDGTERWRYRPESSVPPTSLMPADLDGDGNTEFYATVTSAAVRLDEDAREIWRAPFSAGPIVALASRTRRDPAWIVAQGQGQTVIWNSDGIQLASLTMKDARPLAVIDRPNGRFLLTGGPALRVVGLDGRVEFDWKVEGWTVTDALALALEPGAPPVVALVAAGPDPATRWRLQIVAADRQLLYDERLDTPATLLKARGADGVDRLFVNRASLLTLRPRAP